ncbi:hypothetical protein [Streptomyces sp. NPDC059015]|uniref:hypothetical protein n=1 Tax=unclassified Streptomyces TaxID=2593676 RepID=UPI0036871F95
MRSVVTGVVLPVVLVVGSVGGAAAYTAVTAEGADRTVPTTVWAEPGKEPGKDPAAEAWRGRASTPLGKMLLPVPDGYRLGPDIGEHGNDVELSAAQAVAVMKEWGSGLSGQKRRDYEKRVKRLGVRGIALRSYATEFAERGGVSEGDVVVTIELTRVADRARVREAYEVQTGLAKMLELRKGPKITGHRNAACFLVEAEKRAEGEDAADEDERLGGMQCFAYDSEVLVSVEAQGTAASFDENSVADLVQEQLDHIASPGEYV